MSSSSVIITLWLSGLQFFSFLFIYLFCVFPCSFTYWGLCTCFWGQSCVALNSLCNFWQKGFWGFKVVVFLVKRLWMLWEFCTWNLKSELLSKFHLTLKDLREKVANLAASFGLLGTTIFQLTHHLIGLIVGITEKKEWGVTE